MSQEKMLSQAHKNTEEYTSIWHMSSGQVAATEFNTVSTVGLTLL